MAHEFSAPTPGFDLPGAYPASEGPTPFQEKNFDQISAQQSERASRPAAALPTSEKDVVDNTKHYPGDGIAAGVPFGLAAGTAAGAAAGHHHTQQPEALRSTNANPDNTANRAADDHAGQGFAASGDQSPATHRQHAQRAPSETGYVSQPAATYTARSYPLGDEEPASQTGATGGASSLADPEHSSGHHYGRDAALAGAGAGLAGAAASKERSSVAEHDTGPASHTIGPHGSDLANIVDPRVKPDANLQRSHHAQHHETDPATKDSSNHHYGRDVALVGAGAGLAGAAASKQRSADAEHDTGPAAHTIGHHDTDLANIVDPKVKPDPSLQRSHDVKHPETGPATATVGRHSSNLANILDPRVKPEPSLQHGHEVKNLESGPATKTIGPHSSNLANILDPRVKPDSRYMKSHPEGDKAHSHSAEKDAAGGAAILGASSAAAAYVYHDHDLDEDKWEAGLKEHERANKHHAKDHHHKVEKIQEKYDKKLEKARHEEAVGVKHGKRHDQGMTEEERQHKHLDSLGYLPREHHNENEAEREARHRREEDMKHGQLDKLGYLPGDRGGHAHPETDAEKEARYRREDESSRKQLDKFGYLHGDKGEHGHLEPEAAKAEQHRYWGDMNKPQHGETEAEKQARRRHEEELAAGAGVAGAGTYAAHEHHKHHGQEPGRTSQQGEKDVVKQAQHHHEGEAATGVAGAGAYGAYEHHKHHGQESERSPTGSSHEEGKGVKRRSGILGSIFHREHKDRTSTDRDRASVERERTPVDAEYPHEASRVSPAGGVAPVSENALERPTSDGSGNTSPGKHHGRHRLHKDPPARYLQKHGLVDPASQTS